MIDIEFIRAASARIIPVLYDVQLNLMNQRLR